MAGHRSPRGRRARATVGSPTRHQAAHGSPPTGPTLRTTVLATAAAVGAVATGTFSAIVPTPGDNTNTAAADEGQFDAWLASSSATLPAALPDAGDHLRPVSFLAQDTAEFDTADQHLALLEKAAELAEQLAEEQREQAERERIAALIAQGGLNGWIAEALQILELPQSLAPSVKKIIMAESAGNPRAINNWDSNARRGTPSQGLMQTIPSTFRAYVHPELAHRPITDPVANITAGIRYMIANYGMSTLEAGGRSDSDGDYLGY
ncbi:transglycosylase SLT domain-containing protein [Pseudonocardia nigra]|uniref:transglycosylase SLT domain-containing protein n=1 Tax=Pseudonocardia nigra TaxID=1921578 RepID=UPI001C5E14B2|nr:transglycosylase SLT domain-containing protein [Pseudonocardia nigra]